MENKSSSAKLLLRQQLEALLPRLVARLKTLRDSTDGANLEVLKILAGGSGSYRIKSKEWSSSLDFGDSNEKSILLGMLILLLSTSGRLKNAPFDPLDIRIGRLMERSEPQSNTEDVMQDELQAAQSGENDETVLMKVEKSENLTEDEDVSLIGPLNLDLKRIDSYHPLHSTYRRSTEMRNAQLLNSRHITHARKLRGIDKWDYGFTFNRSVLEKTAPSLEDLNMERLDKVTDLALLQDLAFPRLRRLNAAVAALWDEDNKNPPVLFPHGQDHDGIAWMRVRLPRPTTEALLRDNAKTLLELELCVGTALGHGGWPSQCDDLGAMLARCGVADTLRRLVLVRGQKDQQGYHSRASCQDQVRAVRGSLPGLTVVCSVCCPDTEGPYEEVDPWQRSEWPHHYYY